jgi:hypothetical protein
LDVTKRAENLAEVLDLQKATVFKSLEDYESKLNREGELEGASEETQEEKKGRMITSEAELQKMKTYPSYIFIPY